MVTYTKPSSCIQILKGKGVFFIGENSAFLTKKGGIFTQKSVEKGSIFILENDRMYYLTIGSGGTGVGNGEKFPRSSIPRPAVINYIDGLILLRYKAVLCFYSV